MVDTLCLSQLLDGLLAEGLGSRVVVVLQHLVRDLSGQQGRNRLGRRACHRVSVMREQR
jgi:hypothetical protein